MEIEELHARRSALQKRRPIRNRLLVVGLLVGFTVTLLSASSFLGVYSYRRLVKALSSRASELPQASRLASRVGQLHFFSKFPRQERHCRVIAKSSLQESLMNSLLEIAAMREI